MPDQTPEPHHPCRRCHTTHPAAFTRDTSAFCSACWELMTDSGRRFHAWAAEALRRPRGPFSA